MDRSDYSMISDAELPPSSPVIKMGSQKSREEKLKSENEYVEQLLFCLRL